MRIDDVAHSLETSPDGLSRQEAADRLSRYGPNALAQETGTSAFRRFLLQFHNLLIYVLLAAGLVTVWLQDYVDAAVIFGVVLINAVIGFVQEGKAEHALEAVRAMLASHANVLRDGQRAAIDAADLVPGDLVLIESGDRVPADLRLIQTRNLNIDEAALTGESLPVAKQVEKADSAAALGDRHCMAYAGTVVEVGQALGWVVATGVASEMGQIGQLVKRVGVVDTPLTRRLAQLARQVTLFILVVCALTFAYGWWAATMGPLEMFLAVVGLAVSAIPEGLPAVVTITLAIGTAAMASRQAVVRRLPSVESLGSVSVICTDKTGTLTRNEMTVVQLLLPDGDASVSGVGYEPQGQIELENRPALSEQTAALARCAALCNDAQLQEMAGGLWSVAGDPTEGALLTLALKAGVSLEKIRHEWSRVDNIPFESERQYMATLHRVPGADHAIVMLKGSPERIMAMCETQAGGAPLEREQWLRRMDEAASEGWRVLALAQARVPASQADISAESLGQSFELLGMAAMMDPPRPEAMIAVAESLSAGVRVVMITGDHAVTAAAIGRRMGLRAGEVLSGVEIDSLDERQLKERLARTDVVARASPEHKLRLISALQSQGRLVAMTGDGVNDAPALKAADVGVAMGLRGTDAAREAADLVLTDDNFASITSAVREGRRVFDNIKKTLLFILPTNGGEAGLILLAVFAGWAMPMTAGQILWINMVTSVTLDLSLAFEKAEHGIMRRPPRPARESLITPLLFGRLAYVTGLMLAATWIVFEYEMSRHNDLAVARTAVVNMLAVSEMFYLFNVRRFTASGLTWETLYGNRMAVWACLVTLVLQLLFTYAPPMQALFGSAPLDWDSWGLILGLAVLKFLAVEAEKAVLRWRGVHYL
ncbi:cation-transporting P-type ATPase [Hydrogenophaga sp. 5NK40-0174]